MSSRPTHEVLNQVPPLEDFNLFESDPSLQKAAEREGAGWAKAELKKFGEEFGRAEVYHWAKLANDNTPLLQTHDRFGNRIDEVEFHPAWHRLMAISVRFGLHNLPWRDPKPGAHVARAALMLLGSQIEFGHLCPISMTYSVVPALKQAPKLLEQWREGLMGVEYDPRFIPAPQKKSLLFGMGMTEKQGGSDVRSNTTKAVPLGQGTYAITGHKWFCSAPMNDGFLILAQAEGGLSCFLLPRWTPEGERNRFFIQRLKDKLGNRSNASSEVEFDEAWATLVGEEGRGVSTILEMANHTRLDCVLGSSGLMRQAFTQALHHARHRKAFGKLLIDQSLMDNVLADLALESEAATLLALRLARAYDAQSNPRANPEEGAFRRIATAISKFWVCKRTPPMVAEALECLGGNGFVEDSILPRLYRESPLNSVWEGSGNVICLDVLRALIREPGTSEAFWQEVNLGKDLDPAFAKFCSELQADLAKVTQNPEAQARRLVEKMALALQASLVLRFSPEPTAKAFLRSRIEGDWGCSFGTLPLGTDFKNILEESFP